MKSRSLAELGAMQQHGNHEDRHSDPERQRLAMVSLDGDQTGAEPMRSASRTVWASDHRLPPAEIA